MIRWRLGDLAATLGGALIGDPEVTVTGVSTDSRDVHPGDLFVAVDGETHDGHEYAAAALAAGAAAALVARDAGLAGNRIRVADTLTALRDLAVRRRSELAMPVVAITGSTGKTSTKDLLGAALPGSWAAPRSYNNEIGVPHTIFRTPETARYLVAEVGSRGRGHIAFLMPAIRPDVAVITNLGLVHLETFGSEEALADAKWELVEGLGGNGTAVLPFDEPRLRRTHSGRTLTFGIDPASDIAVSDIVVDPGGLPTFRLRYGAAEERVRLKIAGGHQALNAAAAAAAGIALGLDLGSLAAGMSQAAGSQWRMEIHRGSFTVVNDAYNANPDSMEAAMRTVAAMPGRHVAIVGEMCELGTVTVREHERIGRLAVQLGFAALITVGEEPGIAAAAGTIATNVPDRDAAVAVAVELIRPGDVVLIKASRAVGLEQVAAALIAEAAA
jgi:UDP-N-acetylmuramoyl-tripeptide--D-alanyl-D-alanine ligase